MAEKMVRRCACRKLFIGVDGFDLEHGLTTSNVLEAYLNHHMIAAAQQTIVVTDASKLGLRSFSHICSQAEVNQVIADSSVPEAFVDQLEEHAVEVTVG